MLREPIWLNRPSIDAVQQTLIDVHGGSHGVRDSALIESALARPKNRYFYAASECDLAELAAAYGYGLVKNHGYIDGNKRIGFAARLTFLRRNGYRLVAASGEAVRLIEGVAAGDVSEDELTNWIRERITEA